MKFRSNGAFLEGVELGEVIEGQIVYKARVFAPDDDPTEMFLVYFANGRWYEAPLRFLVPA